MENLRFEESFKDAFSGAEIAPSGVVWTNVELGLEKSSGGKLKGRILFFQLLAAASMVFAMGVGSVYFLGPASEPSHSFAQESFNSKQEDVNLTASENKSVDQIPTNNIAKQADRKLNSKSEIQESYSVVAVSTEQPTLELVTTDAGVISNNRELPKLVVVEQPSLKIRTYEPDPGMLLLAKLHDDEKRFQKNKPTLKEKIWASLGIGAGSYNPNSTATNSRSMVSVSDGKGLSGQSLSDPTSGTSYSVGVSVAGKISKRIVLQGGVSYLNQNSTYTSNTTSGSGAFLNEYMSASRADATYSQVSVTSPYQVNNNLQYMSIPVQAGYIVLDRDFGIQLNAGIATDVFFQNTLTPEGSDLNEVSQGAGADSPYRTLNFSGLLGTELSYKLSDHYRIAVNPGVRYALNSIYKSDVIADVSPVTFDVALRFRYMF